MKKKTKQNQGAKNHKTQKKSHKKESLEVPS